MRDSPAYGARNVSRVTTGTGEALPGPRTCGYVIGSGVPYNRYSGKWVCAGWASEAAIVPIEPTGQHNLR